MRSFDSVSHMISGALPVRFRELFNGRFSTTKDDCIACCFEKGKTLGTKEGHLLHRSYKPLMRRQRPDAIYSGQSKSSTREVHLKYFHCFFLLCHSHFFLHMSFSILKRSFILFMTSLTVNSLPLD